MHACPECRAVQDLTAITLPPGGRLVPCGICGAIWRALPMPVPAAEAQPPSPEPSAAQSANPASASEEPTKPLRRYRAALAQARRGVVVLTAIAAVAGGLAAARDYLAVWMPASRGLFGMLGMPARPSEVAIELVAIVAAERDGAFHVTYEIVNDTALRRPLPTVCATGRDREAERLFRRCFLGDPEGIASQASKRFTFVAAELPAPLADLDLDLQLK